MIGKIILKLGGGCQAIHNFVELSEDKRRVKTYIELSSHSSLGDTTVKSIVADMPIKDWSDLTDYFEEHIDALLHGQEKESYLFLTYELQFQIRALNGHVTSQSEGEFKLEYMLNVGNDPNDRKRRVHLGFRGHVIVSDVRDFITSMRAFLSQIEPQGNKS